MQYKFDIRGNLQPSKIISISWDPFQTDFVFNFKNSETRKQLFDNFVGFINNIQTQITSDFTIWVDGSFITQKLNPRDIDALFLLNFGVCELKKSVLENQFFTKEMKYSKGLDVYYSMEYPQKHKKHFLSHLNHLYWQDVYGHTRKDVFAKQYTKGFIQLKIDTSWKNS